MTYLTRGVSVTNRATGAAAAAGDSLRATRVHLRVTRVVLRARILGFIASCLAKTYVSVDLQSSA